MLYSEFLNLDNTLNENNIDKILDAYASNLGLYTSIVKINAEDKKKNYLNKYYADQLYLYLYNTWKSDLISIYKEKRFVGKYQEMAYRIIKYLEDKKPKDYKEVLKILNTSSIDSKTREALDELKWNRISELSTWQFIHSRTVRFYPKEVPAVHRLYINCNSTYTHQITLEFIKECDKLNLPYRMKFDDAGNRADTIVIWANTKLLPKYIEILRKIKQNNPITENLHKPPVLTGVIDGWIGFASEPDNTKESKKLSFNTKREKHIEKELADVQKKYLYQTIKQKKYDFFRNILEEIINVTVSETINYARDDETFYNVKGYTIADVKSNEFKKLVKDYIYNHQQEIVDYLLGVKNTIDLKIPYKKSKIVISGYRVFSSTKRVFSKTAKKEPKLKKYILEQLKKTAPEFGIDSDKYYLDIDKRKLIEKAVLKETAKKQEEIKPNKTTIPKSPIINQKVTEKITLYTNEDNSVFYVKEIDATRFELHSACNPCRIDNRLCYKISINDAKKLLEGENNSISPYKVDLVVVGRNNNNTQYKK